MRKFLLILVAGYSHAQCPTASPVVTTVCTPTNGGAYYIRSNVKLMPPITSSVAGCTYTWDCPALAMTSGAATPTLTTNYPGTYTLTIIYSAQNCTTVSTHTVNDCPAGTNMVGIEEQEINATPIYFNLRGERVSPTPNTILVERRGLTRRKIIIQ